MKRKKKKFNRFITFFIALAVVSCVLIGRLAYLQINRSEHYTELANRTAITEIPDPAPRGNIVDRKGEILATSKQSYMLTYNETPDNKKYFFETMDKVFKLLDTCKETQQDEFELKINPFRFEFKTNDPQSRKILELKFKKDRAMNEKIQREIFPKEKGKLTKEKEKKIDEELLKITPEETFKYLIDLYKLTPESDFRNLVQIYSKKSLEDLEIFTKRFGITDITELKKLLEEYKKISKNKDRKKLLDSMVSKYGIEAKEYDLDLKRKYMLIRDTIRIQSFSGYKPVIISSNIKSESAFKFLERLNDLPGIDAQVYPLRYYPNGQLGSSFLGYISKISNNSKRYEEKGYDTSTDYIGTAGIESVYEDRLKGSKGGRIVKLNKQGRVIEELGSREAYPGQTIKLTIDKELQKATEDTLRERMKYLRDNPRISYDGANTTNATRGAAVAIDVKTGAVLALASEPGYDPNIFSTPGKLNSDLYNQYFNPDLEKFAKQYIGARNLPITLDELFPPISDKKNALGRVQRKDLYDIYPKPFFNYATSALTAPGSTFKPLTAVAALQEGLLGLNETIHDNLVYTKHGFGGRSWNTSSKGNLSVVEALAFSNNYFFFELGDRLYEKGLDTLAKYGWKFGLGADPNGKATPSTGIEIPEHFGQIFNVQSEKNKLSNIRIWEIYDELKQLRKDKSTGKYDGIDIQINEEDSKESKDLKDKIQDGIKRQMKHRNIPDFSSAMKSLLKQLIENVSALKSKNFNDKEISLAVDKINAKVNAVEEEAKRPGNVYNASIGQGSNQFTPLQLASYTATLASGGTRYKVHLVDEFLDSDNKSIQKVKPEVIEKLNIKPEIIKKVKQGMYAVTSMDEGTASSLKSFPIPNAAKTGSATFNEKIQEDIGRTSSSVIIGFAPYENPEIAVCVFVFDGAHGGNLSPVVEAMYEVYFKDRLKESNYKFKFIKDE